MTTALADQTATLNALLRRADTGDREAIATLHGAADAAPELWREFGDMATQIRMKLVVLLAGKNEFVASATAKEAGRLRRAWAGEEATPLEVALAERIASCWLYLAYVEGAYTQLLAGGEGLTWERDEFHRKRIDQAERRYLRAITALAKVRRLTLPAVQVNIGDKQINMAG